MLQKPARLNSYKDDVMVREGEGSSITIQLADKRTAKCW